MSMHCVISSVLETHLSKIQIRELKKQQKWCILTEIYVANGKFYFYMKRLAHNIIFRIVHYGINGILILWDKDTQRLRMGQGRAEDQDGTRMFRGSGWDRDAQRLRVGQGRSQAQSGTRTFRGSEWVKDVQRLGWDKDARTLKMGQGPSEAQDGTRTLRGLGWDKYAQRLRMR